MSTSPSSLLVAGIGPEPSYGSLVVPTAGIPVTSFAALDVVGFAVDQSWRSSVADGAGHQISTLDGTINMGGWVLPDTLGFPLAGILGDLRVTGASAPFTWTMAALNTGTQQPHSYTVTEKTPAGSVAYPGVLFNKLTVSSSNAAALLAWTAQGVCLAGVPSAAAAPAFSGVLPFPTWRATATIGGVQDATVEDFALNFARATTAKRNTDGTLSPYLQRSELLAYDGSMTVIALADTYRQDLLAGSALPITLSITQGSGSSLTTFTATSTLSYLTRVQRLYGRKWVELSIQWTSDGNTTDAGTSLGLSPVKVTLKNAMASGSY